METEKIMILIIFALNQIAFVWNFIGILKNKK